MLFDLLRVLWAFGLLVVLPGVLLVNAAFPPPRHRLGVAQRAYLALVGGILLSMLLGVVLGFLPHAGKRGHFQTLATGLPNVEVLVLAVCAGLFYVGLVRGAYPSVEARFPALRALVVRTGEPQTR